MLHTYYSDKMQRGDENRINDKKVMMARKVTTTRNTINAASSNKFFP
jgi:hypothetical protein